MYKTIIVVDSQDHGISETDYTIVTFEEYLSAYPKKNEPKTRLLNLCDTEHYLSRGYYCSLLAEARKHRVLPSVSTINDLRALSTELSTGIRLNLPSSVFRIDEGEQVEMFIYLGWTEQEPWRKLAKQIFEKYPAPILQLMVTHDASGIRMSVKRYAHSSLNEMEKIKFNKQLNSFSKEVWSNAASKKSPRWDLAILVNPDEAQPPSDKEAIKRFIKAAEKVGIHAETITAEQANHISQFDALFIRETTAIDHHTYRLARKAEQEGLVVIDDPTSILRCCNKVYLHDAFSYNGVPAPKTHVVINADEESLSRIEAEFSYPMVLKMPEGSFSKGVYKVANRQELTEKLEALFADTALVLVQEYLYTDYDWRVGVLNGRAIYACRYHMARNHWQIYNHDAKRFNSGGFETLPTFEVPKKVLDAALKASAMIGKGLYGVDIKQKDNHVYVIEVNDNPSIDHKVEDLYLGNELYMLVMQEFADRLEKRGR